MVRSLRRQLLGWVLVPLLLAEATSAAVGWSAAEGTANAVQDRLLLGSARMIAEQLHFDDGSVHYAIPPAALALFQSGNVDRIHYGITTGSGQLIAGDAALAGAAPGPETGEPMFFSTRLRGDPVRAVRVQQPVVGAPDERSATVAVAQTLHGRDASRFALWLQAMAAQLLILVLAAVFILFGLRRGLRPMMQLRDVVLARPPGALAPLSLDNVPLELLPLVRALNDHVLQLQQTAQARQLFIENAAHQLRTPLTVLSTQLSFAARTSEPQAHAESLAAIRLTLQHAIRLVNQLLTLSAAQAHGHSGDGFRTLAVEPVVQAALEALAGQAQARQIDLGFEREAIDSRIRCHPTMVHEIVVNLLDNAIRYTQPGGVVTARLLKRRAGLALVVEDNGPGIPEALRTRVFERFFRLDERDASGSGLGLAIVWELTRTLGAEVSLDTGPDGRGLAVTVAFA